ncbi:hypothetical protein PDJAM_G00236580 [Pangasius djambal]|uniref:Uncharacterized protein n=1 Tax=Pangasius djambal TaxID=1691987 RepID=A0ACC5YFG5_9TELE|nr:hypothetical protein [Pangasius djambal]
MLIFCVIFCDVLFVLCILYFKNVLFSSYYSHGVSYSVINIVSNRVNMYRFVYESVFADAVAVGAVR